jgi:hypothetical protein
LRFGFLFGELKTAFGEFGAFDSVEDGVDGSDFPGS